MSWNIEAAGTGLELGGIVQRKVEAQVQHSSNQAAHALNRVDELASEVAATYPDRAIDFKSYGHLDGLGGNLTVNIVIGAPPVVEPPPSNPEE